MTASRATANGRERTGLALFAVAVMLFSWASTVPEALVSRGTINEFGGRAFLDIVAAIAPMLAALVAARRVWPAPSAGRLFGRIFHHWHGKRWYGMAIFGQLALVAAALGLVVLFTDHRVDFDTEALQAFPLLVLGAALLNTWEELGFRGFALRHAESTISPLRATLTVGLIWAVWHVPLFFIAGNPLADASPWWFFAELLGVSFVYTWLFNSTDGSVLFVTLFHVTGNAAGVVLIESGVPLDVYLPARTVVVSAAALGLVSRYGTNLCRPDTFDEPPLAAQLETGGPG